MDKQTFDLQMKRGEVEVLEEKVSGQAIGETQSKTGATIEDYITFLELLKMIKKHRTTAPTYTPKSFIEQISLYDDGVNYRLYLYVNGSWRYVSLT